MSADASSTTPAAADAATVLASPLRPAVPARQVVDLHVKLEAVEQHLPRNSALRMTDAVAHQVIISCIGIMKFCACKAIGLRAGGRRVFLSRTRSASEKATLPFCSMLSAA